jgi:hypothetical protein
MGNYATDQREQEQIIGVITGVVQKGPDKWQAVVAPDGSQYTKNLWTKDAALIGYLSSQIGNRLAFLCNVSHWTNQSNQPVRSLWIEAAGSPTVGSPALAGPPAQAAQAPQQSFPPPQQPQQQSAVVQPQAQAMGTMAPREDLREAKIHRQTASKVAAILLGYLPESDRNLATLLVLSERLIAYYDNGMPQAETLDELMNRAMPASMDEGGYDPAQGTGYANTPPADDDIPF